MQQAKLDFKCVVGGTHTYIITYQLLRQETRSPRHALCCDVDHLQKNNSIE